MILTILLLLLFGIIYNIYLKYRYKEMHKMKCKLINYVYKTAKKEIRRSSKFKKVNDWNIYYDFLEKSFNENRLLYDFRINLNKFKENFMKEIDKLYERNK